MRRVRLPERLSLPKGTAHNARKGHHNSAQRHERGPGNVEFNALLFGSSVSARFTSVSTHGRHRTPGRGERNARGYMKRWHPESRSNRKRVLQRNSNVRRGAPRHTTRGRSNSCSSPPCRTPSCLLGSVCVDRTPRIPCLKVLHHFHDTA